MGCFTIGDPRVRFELAKSERLLQRRNSREPTRRRTEETLDRTEGARRGPEGAQASGCWEPTDEKKNPRRRDSSEGCCTRERATSLSSRCVDTARGPGQRGRGGRNYASEITFSRPFHDCTFEKSLPLDTRDEVNAMVR